MLTTSVLNAASRVGVSDQGIAAIFGIPLSVVSQLLFGDEMLVDGPIFEKGVKLVSIYWRLLEILGSESKHLSVWFHANNAILGAPPCSLVRFPGGISKGLSYLDEQVQRL
jgi:hypothetical protein